MNKSIAIAAILLAFVTGTLVSTVALGDDGLTKLQKICSKEPKFPDKIRPDCELLKMIEDLQSQIDENAENEPQIETTIRTQTHPFGQVGPTEVSCESDEILTGGGYKSTPYRPDISVSQNGPTSDGNGWIVELGLGVNTLGGNLEYEVFAICQKLS